MAFGECTRRSHRRPTMPAEDAMTQPPITIPEQEIVARFVRATGPGEQNVNKVATAVELRFDIAKSPSLPEPVRARPLENGSASCRERGCQSVSSTGGAVTVKKKN